MADSSPLSLRSRSGETRSSDSPEPARKRQRTEPELQLQTQHNNEDAGEEETQFWTPLTSSVIATIRTKASDDDGPFHSAVDLPDFERPDDNIAHQSPPNGEEDQNLTRSKKRVRSPDPVPSEGEDDPQAMSEIEVSRPSSPINGTALDDPDDSDAAPETVSTHIKHSIPFPSTAKRPKSKKKAKQIPKPPSSGPLIETNPSTANATVGDSQANSPTDPSAAVLQESLRATVAQAEVEKDGEEQIEAETGPELDQHLHPDLSGPPSHSPSTQITKSKSKSKPFVQPTKQSRPKDRVRNGVIYRSFLTQPGGGSPWLPAKVDRRSVDKRSKLLVRKRVQDMSAGRGPGGRGRGIVRI